jgi:3-oxoacyl-[acyl-carrier protein] reductase
MNLQLAGLHAVVTGGSSGIGAAIVHAFAAEGCKVSFCARRQDKIDATLHGCAGLPGAVQARTVDVTHEADFKAWLEALGTFDIFIANVSALSGAWEDALQTDIRATVNATEAALPFLLQSHHGALTYIGSKAGSLAAPESAAYGAAKAAMAHYMKSLSVRLLPTVRVNTVSPGDTLVPEGFWDRVRQCDPERFEAARQRNPMQRFAAAEEIARVVAFVSSPVASFVAGANWYVDGGSTSHVQF